ncbi:2976_t:CDS:2 [Ambispora gerdemannii]|uniref:2976_t:CDS:1 n=1 Tax=Ambispora gerdemannii TaxID=144530 RepID=A0A9N9AK98_9GLOM|nr:2976_t:CDS:2 [Ambispora gerdemannii]
MAFNPSSINLEVLFNSKEKAENFIKKFADGYKQIMSYYLNLKENRSTKNRLNSPNPIQNYYGLKHLYESKIIPDVEIRIRKKIESKNPGLSKAQINLIFGQEKGTNIEFLRKNLEYTRISAAFNAIKPNGELESDIPNGFGIGKATCGTCGKDKGDEEEDSYNSDSGSPPKTNNCFFCRQQYRYGVYFEDNPGMEKENFIKQVNSSDPMQFRNIFKQVKQLLNSKKRKSEEDQTSGKGEESGKNNSSDNDNSNTVIPESNSNNNSPNLPEPQNDNQPVTNNLPTDIQAIANLPLPQAQIKAEQEIEKLLKDNALSDQELDTKNLLDTPQKVAEFTNQMRQAILKKALTKKNSTKGEGKPQDMGLVKPIAILVLLLLVLTTLLIIVRKRRMRRV